MNSPLHYVKLAEIKVWIGSVCIICGQGYFNDYGSRLKLKKIHEMSHPLESGFNV
ncbi:hypothetical protein [Bacillus atrophaeus]|uniref:hypothetical protein n=1 Tax=Bacillus atrophaeus TaxID=1452 RepID=UPI002E2255A7|nr:hypothetical protein [Bacillus atrophaeus]MED1120442.1 hypothetical protein [Bacillus atrophaeus]